MDADLETPFDFGDVGSESWNDDWLAEPPWVEPPPAPNGDRGPRRGPAPMSDAEDVRQFTLYMTVSVFILALFKLAFLAVGGQLATMLVAAVFVAAHGAFIAFGGSWFWNSRYR